MRQPINSKNISIVEYPSSIFSLEKHEIYPYERFAYNILSVGIEALYKKSLPESIQISFLEGINDNMWWYFNAGISKLNLPSGETKGFYIGTSPISPLFIFGICHKLGLPLFSKHQEYVSKPSSFKELLVLFTNRFTESLNYFINDGLGSLIRDFNNKQEIKIFDIENSRHYYDICTKIIANHEIAHAYVGQLQDSIRELNSSEYRAFEYIVDIIAVEWLYNKMIVNTPDTDEYREYRGISTHSECILLNAINCVQGLILIFIILSIASAIAYNGKIVLDGGRFHPNTLYRYIMQTIHFTKLLETNYIDLLTDEQFDSIHAYLTSIISIFIKLGFFTIEDLQSFRNDSRIEDFLLAYHLIDEFNITELVNSKEIFKLSYEIYKEQENINKFNILSNF